MNSKALLLGALFGFIYSLIGYGGFLVWNYIAISQPPVTYETKMDGFVIGLFVGLYGLISQILFIPGSYILQFFKNLGVPVFTTHVPFPYHGSIPTIGIFLGFIILTLLGGLLGFVIFLVVRSFKSKRENH